MSAAVTLASVILLPITVHWSHVLSQDAFFSVNPWVSYREVKAHPERHLGITLMLAGEIVETTTSREGTELEILCYTRDEEDRPEEPEVECGRFLAKTPRILDPDKFSRGRKVTLTGTLVGQQRLSVGGVDYECPVFRIGEVYLWPKTGRSHWRRYPFDSYWDPFPRPYWDPFYRYPW